MNPLLTPRRTPATAAAPLRIGVMCHSGLGGSGVIGTRLALQLAQRGHRVHLFSHHRPIALGEGAPGLTLHSEHEQPRHEDAGRLRVEWSTATLAEFAERVDRVIDGEGLDVLHWHYALPFAFVAEQLWRRRGWAPITIGTLHGTDVTTCRENPLLLARLRRSLSELDGLTTVSKNHALLAKQILGLDAIEIIPNFVDPERFAPASTRPPGAPRRIAHVSNFRPVKNPLAVARIFARVRRCEDATLRLVGAGECMPQVRELLARAELLSTVDFLGQRIDVAEILRGSDLLLMTSRAESFCLVALEAMACGVPVVASRVGGLPEIVRDGETGILFDADDERSAARAVLRLLRDDELRAEMSLNARRRARLFDPRLVVDRYVSLYRQTTERAGAPRPWGAVPERGPDQGAADLPTYRGSERTLR